MSPSATTRNLSVVLDNQLYCTANITAVAAFCRLAGLQPFLMREAAQLLVQALVICRLDYCNSLLGGLPVSAIKPQQHIQNAQHTCLVFNLPKFSPLPEPPLPPCSRIRFKTRVLPYKVVNETAPPTSKQWSDAIPQLRSTTSASRLIPPSLRGRKGH